jgi:hypothetical protein
VRWRTNSDLASRAETAYRQRMYELLVLYAGRTVTVNRWSIVGADWRQVDEIRDPETWVVSAIE